MRLAVLAVLVSCGHPKALPADIPAEVPPDQTRRYTIWLGGARVGTAIESETWQRDGVRLRRDETLRFLRGDADVTLATSIIIDADAALVARRVRWTEHGGDVRGAEALRLHDAWRVSTGGKLAMEAVPAELVPLLVRRDGAFAGTVFLPARGFVAGAGRIDPVAPGRLVARLALDGGPVVEATIDLDRDGAPARIVDGDGVIAIRATAEQAAEAFPIVDLIAATAIPIAGTRRTNRLILEGNLALPALPGQRAQLSATGVEVELDAALGAMPPEDAQADRTAEIRALVAAVRNRITPDLAASPGSARDAATATAGDCTTFALAYAALASRRGIRTRVVTGLRVDGAGRSEAAPLGPAGRSEAAPLGPAGRSEAAPLGPAGRSEAAPLGPAGRSEAAPLGGERLIRHRWAASWTGARWIAIDAAFGAVPAGGNLIGLAVHDADDAGLVAGEAALTQVRAAAWAP